MNDIFKLRQDVNYILKRLRCLKCEDTSQNIFKLSTGSFDDTNQISNDNSDVKNIYFSNEFFEVTQDLNSTFIKGYTPTLQAVLSGGNFANLGFALNDVSNNSSAEIRLDIPNLSRLNLGTDFFVQSNKSFNQGQIISPLGSIAFNTNGLNRIKINNQGNVAIGDFEPDAKFHCVGTVKLQGLNNATGDFTFDKYVVIKSDGTVGYENKPVSKSVMYIEGLLIQSNVNTFNFINVSSTGNLTPTITCQKLSDGKYLMHLDTNIDNSDNKWRVHVSVQQKTYGPETEAISDLVKATVAFLPNSTNMRVTTFFMSFRNDILSDMVLNNKILFTFIKIDNDSNSF